MLCKNKIKKKGISHVEVIVSLSLFLIFLFILLSFFNPLKKQEVNSVLLSILEDGIKKEASINVMTTSVIINDSVFSRIGNCFSIVNITKIGEGKSIVKTADGKVNATRKGDRIYIHKKNGQRVYDIFISKRFSEMPLANISDCDNLIEERNYNFGITKEKSFLFLSDLERIKTKYEINYDDFKKKINFPEENDFVFSLKSYSGENILNIEKQIPVGINVLAKDVGVEIIDENGTIKSALLNLKVW